MLIGYELLDSEQGAEHWFGYHKFISRNVSGITVKILNTKHLEFYFLLTQVFGHYEINFL